MSENALRDQLVYSHDAVYVTEGWIQPLLPTLRELSAQDAAWKPSPDSKSIWEIVAHLTNYTEDLATDLRGIEIGKFEDWPPVVDTSDGPWKALLGRLERSVASLGEIVPTLTADELAAPPPGLKSPRWERIADIQTHNAYHAGQVYQLAGLRKAIGERVTALPV